eukprot:152719_1
MPKIKLHMQLETKLISCEILIKSSLNVDQQTGGSVKAIMVKNTILTVSISGSTLILWIGYFIFGNECFLWIDMLSNCLCLGLMFRFNDSLYSRFFCKLCHDFYLKRSNVLELKNIVTSNSEITRTASG